MLHKVPLNRCYVHGFNVRHSNLNFTLKALFQCFRYKRNMEYIKIMEWQFRAFGREFNAFYESRIYLIMDNQNIHFFPSNNFIGESEGWLGECLSVCGWHLWHIQNSIASTLNFSGNCGGTFRSIIEPNESLRECSPFRVEINEDPQDFVFCN